MNNYFTCCCQHQTPGEEEKRQAEYQEAPQLHPVQDLSRIIVVAKCHLKSLVSTPGQGLLMCQTVRTTETPGRRPIVPVNFIHLCAAPALKIKQILYTKIKKSMIYKPAYIR